MFKHIRIRNINPKHVQEAGPSSEKHLLHRRQHELLRLQPRHRRHPRGLQASGRSCGFEGQLVRATDATTKGRKSSVVVVYHHSPQPFSLKH